MDAGQITLEQPSDPRGQATVRICRPGAGNALSREAAEELSAAVDILAADSPAGVGRRVGPKEAAAVRMVHTVVPAGQAEPAARDVIALASSASRDAIRAVSAVVDPTATAADVANIFSELGVGDDHRAAEAAWRERRQRTAAELPR
jgi:enoyl-CoA hydratase/carnithine racemase